MCPFIKEKLKKRYIYLSGFSNRYYYIVIFATEPVLSS